MRRRYLTAAVVACVVVSLAVAVATQWSRLPDISWRLDPVWLAASIAALALFHWAHAAVWGVMLVRLGSPLGRRDVVAIWSASLLGRYVPASFLMPVIRVVLAADRGVPRRVSATSVVYELALTFSAAVLLGAWAILEVPGLSDSPWRFALLAAPLAALVLLHPRVLSAIGERLLARVPGAGSLVTLSVPAMAWLVVLYAAGFLVAGLAVAALAHALFPVEAEDVPALVAAYPVGFAFSLVAFVVPAGLGAREAALAAVASLVVPVGVAVAAAVGTRLIQVGVELAFAGVGGWLTRGSRMPTLATLRDAAQRSDQP